MFLFCSEAKRKGKRQKSAAWPAHPPQPVNLSHSATGAKSRPLWHLGDIISVRDQIVIGAEGAEGDPGQSGLVRNFGA
jgi:hypothetical protein